MLCLNVAGINLKECPSKNKECLICKQSHHVNLHPRKDVLEAFKKLKEAKNPEYMTQIAIAVTVWQP